MASLMLGQVRSRRILRLLAFVACILVWGSSSEAGYLYQTRFTQHSPNVARFRHVSSRLGDGRVGVFGGFGKVDVELFDPATEQFTISRATQWFADFGGITLPNGNVLLVDGEHDCVFDYLVEQYVPTANRYTGGFIRFPVLLSLPDGKVFICAGSNTDFEPGTACGIFDPRTLRFRALGDLAIPRVDHTAVLFNDHQVLVAGGYNYIAPTEMVTLDSLEIFDTNTGRSARIRTSLQHARYSHCSVALPDGRVLILGGGSYPGERWIRSVEIFDPNTSTISEGPALGLGRSGAQIALLPSGRIAVFGGNPDARTVEIYCPDTGTFELAQNLLLEARWSGLTATSLESGAVLLIGGQIGGGEEVAQNAEIFEEVATETPSAPAMTAASIRGLLTDRDPNVVNETATWLVSLGPQVRPILDTLAQDESPDLARQAGSIVQSIDEGDYPEIWCVEIWNASGRLDTVWLDNFECPDSYSPGFPSANFTTILRATEGVDLTQLVVRFPTHASYEARVKLFNLVGWTWIPKVTLGESLSKDKLARVVVPAAK